MKAFILLSSLLVFLAIVSHTASAVDITFTSSGTIQDGDSYVRVFVKNDDTVVDMTGGQITLGLTTYNTSIFNLMGGTITTASINVGPSSTLNILDGYISGSFEPKENSYTHILGGNIHFGMKAYGGCIVDIKGGNVQIDQFYTGGGLGTPSINIYGSNFDYTNGTITGNLLDGNSFTISGVNESEYAYFHLIPEPMTLLLFTSGMLLLRKRKIGYYKIREA